MPLFDHTRGGGVIMPYTAENTITAMQFVAKGTGAKQVTATTAEGASCVGVALGDQGQTFAAGEQVQILVWGVTLVKAGAAVARDTLLKVDSTDGMVDDFTAGVTTAKHVVGKALEAATADGDIISVFVGLNSHGAV